MNAQSKYNSTSRPKTAKFKKNGGTNLSRQNESANKRNSIYK